MAYVAHARLPVANPLEVVEDIARTNAWPFEREVEDEISFLIVGSCANYQVSFTWMSTIEVLHLSCAFDSCERYYPAFQYVAWAGKSADDAMNSVMLETVGEA